MLGSPTFQSKVSLQIIHRKINTFFYIFYIFSYSETLMPLKIPKMGEFPYKLFLDFYILSIAIQHNVFMERARNLPLFPCTQILYKPKRLCYTEYQHREKEGLRMQGMNREMSKYRVAIYTQVSSNALQGGSLPIGDRSASAACAG